MVNGGRRHLDDDLPLPGDRLVDVGADRWSTGFPEHCGIHGFLLVGPPA
jgi:hypothetical protein